MVISLEALLVLCLLSVPIYWLLPDRTLDLRACFLICLSALVIYSLSPLIFVWLLGYCAIVAILLGGAKYGLKAQLLKVLTWFLFLPIALIELVPKGFLTNLVGWENELQYPRVSQFALLGLSYCAIRAFLVVREGIARKDFRIVPAYTALLFFGTYVAGPIAGSNQYVADARAKSLTAYDAAIALCRIGWGAALFLVVKPLISGADIAQLLGWEKGSHATALAWLFIYHSFLNLYVDFYGYCEVAIGVGLLFGIRVPENFRAPLISRSMQEFWQRWHLTLGAFVSTYLFKPLVRSWGQTTLAIFIAFTLIGLWHQFTWTYLLWGMGHGGGLALNMILNKRYGDRVLGPLQKFRLGLIGWVLTMTWVSLLSAIANSENLAKAGELCASLLGL